LGGTVVPFLLRQLLWAVLKTRDGVRGVLAATPLALGALVGCVFRLVTERNKNKYTREEEQAVQEGVRCQHLKNEYF
jgi:hypothetical protein